ncbi:DUF6809 domain-containing protein, partial [Dysosmobacter welbionis]
RTGCKGSCTRWQYHRCKAGSLPLFSHHPVGGQRGAQQSQLHERRPNHLRQLHRIYSRAPAHCAGDAPEQTHWHPAGRSVALSMVS